MRTRFLFLAALGVLSGCGGPEVDLRYRAERELWVADQVRDGLEQSATSYGHRGWRGLVERYRQIADGLLDDPRVDAYPSVQRVAARALLNSAEIHAALQDSTAVDELLAGMTTRFATVPAVLAEVELWRGRIAESHAEVTDAVEHYRRVVELVPAGPGGLGLVAMELPLHIARLAGRESVVGVDLQRTEEARGAYAALMNDPRTRVQLRAQHLAAQAEAEQGHAEEAIRLLDDLALRLLELEHPPIDPAVVRLDALRARVGEGPLATADSTQAQAALAILLEQHGDTESAARALLIMSEAAERAGDRETALTFLRRVESAFVGKGLVPDDLLAEAALRRARIEEEAGEWAQAYRTYRTVSVDFPLSDAALRAPLLIVDHWVEAGLETYAREALADAASHYRTMMQRYPHGEHTGRVRERLVECLVRMGQPRQAMIENLELLESVRHDPREPALLMAAARLAFVDLADTLQGVELLERAARDYPETRTGAWSARRAAQLRAAVGRQVSP